MSDYAKGLENVDRFTSRVKESLATRKHRILDDRDDALADALKNIEARSDDYYPAVTGYDEALTGLAASALTGLVIGGTNLVGAAEKATGSTADSTGQITFEAVVPGEQTITVTITDDGGALTITADAAAGTIDITHGAGGSGAGGVSTAAEIVAAVDSDATAKFMVEATVDTAGDIDADETVTVETTGADPGSLPVLQIGSTTLDGTTAGNGITVWSDTQITFDYDASGLSAGETVMLRLWVDDVLVLQAPLVAAAGSISTSEIADEAITLAKMADLARGSIISGQTGNNRPTALDAKGSGKILVGDGTDVNSVSMSGQATIDPAGAVTLQGTPTFTDVGTTPDAAAAGAGVVATSEQLQVRTLLLTLTDVAVPLADEAGVVAYGSLKICDLPAGAILFLGAVMDLALTKSSAGVNDDWDGDIGLGTTAAGNDANLATTEQDLVPTTATPQAVAGATTGDGESTSTEAAKVFDGTTTAVDVFLNILVDDADHDVTGTPCNIIVNGTIKLTYVNLGDN